MSSCGMLIVIMIAWICFLMYLKY